MDNGQSAASPFQAQVVARNWLSSSAFELILEKPDGFHFQPGQKVMLTIDTHCREYSLANAPSEDALRFCVRLVHGGTVSNMLARLHPGERLRLSAAYGFFVYRKGRAVCVATGTGVAPFVSYCRSGIRDFVLLHGVSTPEELYYRDILQHCAARYIPCISGGDKVREMDGVYCGRVTQYLRERFLGDGYSFYLCGNGGMIRDAIAIIDNSFPDAKIFTETFYH